jgi:transcriptional regulator with XRE-family HTH domain
MTATMGVTMARLEALRRRRALSQRALAKAAGLSYRTVFNVERGVTKAPQLRVVRAISDALGVDPAEVDEFRGPLGLPPAGGKTGSGEDAKTGAWEPGEPG